MGGARVGWPPVSETRQARTARYAEDFGRIGTLDKQAPDVASVLIGPRPCGHTVRAQLRFGGDGRVLEAKWKSFGCGRLNAAMAFACEWVEGRALEEVETGLEPALVDALEQPTEWTHCTQLVVEVVTKAAKSARLARV